MAPKHIVDRINDAQLPATMYRTARLLLDLANPTTGETAVTHDQMRAIAGTDSDGTVRKHLIRLQAAGIATYQRNAIVHVWFADWQPNNVHDTVHRSAPVRGSDPVARDSRGSVPPARADAHFDVRASDPPARDSRAGSTNRALDAHLPHTHASAHSGLIDRSTNTTDQINQSLPAPDPTAIALLSDSEVRVAVRDATALAAKHSLAVIRTCVGAWYMNRKCVGGKLEDRSAGVAVYWLKECAGAPSNVFDDRAWQRTDLYRRHRSAEELEAERLAEVEAAERLAMMDVPPAPEPRRELDPDVSPYLDQDPVWQWLAGGSNLADDLAGLVRIDHVDGVPLYVLAARDPLRVAWLTQRLVTRLRKAATVAAGRPALVEIVPPIAAGGLTDGNT